MIGYLYEILEQKYAVLNVFSKNFRLFKTIFCVLFPLVFNLCHLQVVLILSFAGGMISSRR